MANEIVSRLSAGPDLATKPCYRVLCHVFFAAVSLYAGRGLLAPLRVRRIRGAEHAASRSTVMPPKHAEKVSD